MLRASGMARLAVSMKREAMPPEDADDDLRPPRLRPADEPELLLRPDAPELLALLALALLRPRRALLLLAPLRPRLPLSCWLLLALRPAVERRDVAGRPRFAAPLRAEDRLREPALRPDFRALPCSCSSPPFSIDVSAVILLLLQVCSGWSGGSLPRITRFAVTAAGRPCEPA